jgi:hypothetical protein
MLSVTCTSDSSVAVDMQASVKFAVCIGGEPVHRQGTSFNKHFRPKANDDEELQ